MLQDQGENVFLCNIVNRVTENGKEIPNAGFCHRQVESLPLESLPRGASPFEPLGKAACGRN